MSDETNKCTTERPSGSTPPDCSAHDLRKASKIIRWIKQDAEEQLNKLPWWKRLFLSYPEEYLNLMVSNIEDMADELQNAKGDCR